MLGWHDGETDTGDEETGPRVPGSQLAPDGRRLGLGALASDRGCLIPLAIALHDQ
jgi:hypothetical protein